MATIRRRRRRPHRRAGFDAGRVRTLVRAFRILFGERTNIRLAMERVGAECRSPDVDEVLAFIGAAKRGVAMGPRHGREGSDDDAE